MTASSSTHDQPSAPKRAPRGASFWSLTLNVFSKSQTLALLVAGSIMDGLVGVGVIVTAMAACMLGQALADFGLTGELARLNVAYPSRATVDRSVRSVIRQAPLALLFAPVAYLVLGPPGGSPVLLIVLAVNSAFLVGTIAFTAILNGLGDFKTPAVRLGGARFVSSFVAVAAAAVEPEPVAVIGSFALAEGIGVVGLALALRTTRAHLSAADHADAHVRRARAWFGISTVVYLTTNQGDTLLAASILDPVALGLFATASTLHNGVATLATAAATPKTFESVGTTLSGRREEGADALKKAFVTAVGVAVVFGVVTWAVTQIAGGYIEKFAGLSEGDGPAVVALSLAACPLAAAFAVCLLTGAGFARHRPVGMSQIKVGIVATIAIVGGAHLAGAVGAAAGTVIRDMIGLALARRLTAAPSPTESQGGGTSPDPAVEASIDASLRRP